MQLTYDCEIGSRVSCQRALKVDPAPEEASVQVVNVSDSQKAFDALGLHLLVGHLKVGPTVEGVGIRPVPGGLFWATPPQVVAVDWVGAALLVPNHQDGRVASGGSRGVAWQEGGSSDDGHALLSYNSLLLTWKKSANGKTRVRLAAGTKERIPFLWREGTGVGQGVLRFSPDSE